MTASQWAQLCLLGAVWGASFFFSKVALDESGPLTIVLIRVVLAAVVLNLLLPFQRLRLPLDCRTWGWFAGMGLLNNLIPFGLIFWGQTQLPSSLASILNASTPIFAVLLGHFVLRSERLTANRAAGVIIGFGGVALMFAPGIAGAATGSPLAQVAVLGAAVCYALAGFYARRFRDIPPLITSAGQLTASAFMVLPVAALLERPWEHLPHSAAVLASLAALGVVCTALAYVLYFRLLATAGATNALLVTFLIPVSATLLGVGILGERLQTWQFGGMGLILGGLAVIDGRILRRGRNKA